MHKYSWIYNSFFDTYFSEENLNIKKSSEVNAKEKSRPENNDKR